MVNIHHCDAKHLGRQCCLKVENWREPLGGLHLQILMLEMLALVVLEVALW